MPMLVPAFLVTAIGATAASVVTSVVVMGALAGLQMLMNKPPKPKDAGSQTEWQADPTAGLPYIMGRTATSGKVVYRTSTGSALHWQHIYTVHSAAGPVESFDQLYFDGKPYSVTANQVSMSNNDVWEEHQLGETPESSYLSLNPAAGRGDGTLAPAEWDSTHQLNGMAASHVILHWDTKGDNTLTQVPVLLWGMHGVKVYDPRKDSTYPGGSGSHRWADPSNTAAHDAARATWEWSENPYLHALHWLLGRWERDPLTIGSTYQKVMGVGIPINSIITTQYVEAANICDTNLWTVGGEVSSTDDKWDVLKNILIAGGGQPVRLGAKIGCIINAPKVSLATLTEDDVVGDASLRATQARRERINCVIPRVRFEDLIWEQDAATPVVVPAYVTFDGRQRNREVTYELVQVAAGQQPTQAVQLARYEIEDSREIGPIVLPAKLRWMGYQPGDCITVTHSELGLNGQLVLLLSRDLDPGTGIVTLTGRSETFAKHAFALGQTGVAPATPTVTVPPTPPRPSATAWALTATTLTASGTTLPALLCAVNVPDPVGDIVDAIVFETRPYNVSNGVDDNWSGAGIESPAILKKYITGLLDGTAYEVSIRYRMGAGIGARRILGPVTLGSTIASGINGQGAGATANDLADLDAAADALLTTTAGNFNSRNDRSTASIPSPVVASDGSDIDHTLRAGGAVDLSFQWSWSGSEPKIDGFLVALATMDQHAVRGGVVPVVAGSMFFG